MPYGHTLGTTRWREREPTFARASSGRQSRNEIREVGNRSQGPIEIRGPDNIPGSLEVRETGNRRLNEEGEAPRRARQRVAIRRKKKSTVAE
jgi:hypothetical protein